MSEWVSKGEIEIKRKGASDDGKKEDWIAECMCIFLEYIALIYQCCINTVPFYENRKRTLQRTQADDALCTNATLRSSVRSVGRSFCKCILKFPRLPILERTHFEAMIRNRCFKVDLFCLGMSLLCARKCQPKVPTLYVMFNYVMLSTIKRMRLLLCMFT